MKTNYISHDSAYQRKKAAGEHSWGGKEIFENNIKDLRLELPELVSNAKILEIGCGNGVTSLWLAERGYQAYGIDIAPTAINWANELKNEKKLQADFRVGSVLDLSCYGKEFFDLVLDQFCLHCIIGDDRKILLEQVYNVLQPDGYFLVQTMCDEPLNDVKFCYDQVSRCMVQNGIAGRYFGKAEDIIKELQYAGFKIERQRIDGAGNDNEQDTLFALCRK